LILYKADVRYTYRWEVEFKLKNTAQWQETKPGQEYPVLEHNHSVNVKLLVQDHVT